MVWEREGSLLAAAQKGRGEATLYVTRQKVGKAHFSKCMQSTALVTPYPPQTASQRTYNTDSGMRSGVQMHSL